MAKDKEYMLLIIPEFFLVESLPAIHVRHETIYQATVQSYSGKPRPTWAFQGAEPEKEPSPKHQSYQSISMALLCPKKKYQWHYLVNDSGIPIKEKEAGWSPSPP